MGQQGEGKKKKKKENRTEQERRRKKRLKQWLLVLQVEAGLNPQLVFHTFSQAGWASYANMLGWIVRRNSCLHDRIAAAIIDSAPYAEVPLRLGP